MSAAVLAAVNLAVVWYYSARLERLTKDAYTRQPIWDIMVAMAPLTFLDVQLARGEHLVAVLKSGTPLGEWDHEIVALDAAVREVLSRTSIVRAARPAVARLSDAVRYVRESTRTGDTLVPACEQFQRFAAQSRSAISQRVKDLEAIRSAVQG